MKSSKPTYRHTVRLFVLIGLALVIALVVRSRLVPESFGDAGHFRSDAVAEARQYPVRHLGREVCGDCHGDVLELHAKDAHAPVECETCHGPGARHVSAEGDGNIRRPEGRQPCLVCHRLLPARPGDFGQITPEQHMQLVGVKDADLACTACHDPHEPFYMDRDLRQARLHPLIHRCRDCHIGRTDETLHRPAEHPEIFECEYCHAEVVRGFDQRPHRDLRCTACHVFFKESDSAGRMLRDTDPRFCLLCHREADFRSADAAPQITWPDHREMMADGEADLDKRCTDCHQDRIHPLPPRSAAVGNTSSSAGS